MKPRSAKAKGTRLEKWVVSELEGLGVKARKQPGSGIYSDFPHDVQCWIADKRYIVECKSWKHGWRTGDNAMGKADVLVVKADHSEPRVYMTWDMFSELVKQAALEEG